MNFLPGWEDDFISAGAGVMLSFVSQTGSSGNTLTFPASGIEPGDLLIYAGCGFLNGGTAEVEAFLPSGFTNIIYNSSTSIGGDEAGALRIAYKIAVGNEESTAVTIAEGNFGLSEVGAALIQFRPNKPIASVSVLGTASQLSSGDPGSQTLGSGLDYSLHFAAFATDGTLSGVSYTPTQTAEFDMPVDDGDGLVRWTIRNPLISPVAITVDMADGGSANMLGSCVIKALSAIG